MVATREERIIIPGVLESVLRYCLKDASERMEKGEQVLPFSALAVKDKLFMEEHPGETADESFAAARKTVAGSPDAKAYAFCYDGFIEAESAVGNKLVQRDCIIAEGGMPGTEYGHAIGLIYKTDKEGNVTFNSEPIYVSKSLNYMLHAVTLDDDEEEEAEAEEDEA